MTTQEQIEKVEAFCEKVQTIEGVTKAYVDDYGRFGNFSVIIVREKYINGDKGARISKINFRNILPTAKKFTREANLIWRSNELHPTNKYVNMVDIDCQHYDPISNRFQEQIDNPEKYTEDGFQKQIEI